MLGHIFLFIFGGIEENKSSEIDWPLLLVCMSCQECTLHAKSARNIKICTTLIVRSNLKSFDSLFQELYVLLQWNSRFVVQLQLKQHLLLVRLLTRSPVFDSFFVRKVHSMSKAAEVWAGIPSKGSSIKDVGIFWAVFDNPLPHVKILTLIYQPSTF